MNRDKLRDELIRDEGWRDRPYVDTVGKITIGVGRNLTDVGVSEADIERWLDEDIATAEQAADRLCERLAHRSLDTMTDARQRALVNMALNLGETRLAAFKGMWAAIRRSDWAGAAVEMLDSKWARQVGARATRLSKMMREG